jgi:hypothetical protein
MACLFSADLARTWRQNVWILLMVCISQCDRFQRRSSEAPAAASISELN